MGNVLSNGTLISCSVGAAPGPLTILPTHKSSSTGQPLANMQDAVPLLNIPSFGACAICPMCPCVPKTAAWVGASHTLNDKAPTFDTGAKAICAMGGIIGVIAPGQVPAQL